MNGLLLDAVGYAPRDVFSASTNGNVPVISGLKLLQNVCEADVGISDDDRTNFA